MAAKRTLSKTTLLEKYAALKAIDNGESQASVAKRLGLPKTTIANWKKFSTYFISMKSRHN